MRAERSLSTFVFLVFMACGGCGLLGGPEGTYTLDRERTKAGMERYAVQTIAQLAGEEKIERKKFLEEAGTIIDQISVEIHLDRGGKFRGQSKLDVLKETFEGTWTLQGDKLETKTVSKNGTQLPSPKVEALHYEDGRLSYQDADVPFPFLVLSKQ
jgi:hypothetical protein